MDYTWFAAVSLDYTWFAAGIATSPVAGMSDIDLQVMDVEGNPAGDPVAPEAQQSDPSPPAEDSPPSPDNPPSSTSGAGSPEPLLAAKEEENGVTSSGEAEELPEKETVVTTTVIVNVGVGETETEKSRDEVSVQKEYVIINVYLLRYHLASQSVCSAGDGTGVGCVCVEDTGCGYV